MVSEGPGISPKSLLRDFYLSLTPSVFLCLFVQPRLSVANSVTFPGVTSIAASPGSHSTLTSL